MRKFRAILVAFAFGLVAQGSQATEQAAEGASKPTPLLKPAPIDRSPFLPKAEAAARVKFPDLFKGKFTGTIGVYVDLNIDGDILSLASIQFPPGPLSDRSLGKERSDSLAEETLHNAYRRAGAEGAKFIGWFGTKHNNGLYLHYRVLKWRIDPSRTIAQVRTAVATQYPKYFKPGLLKTTADESSDSIVTIVMNDDGTLAGSTLVESGNPDEFSDRRTFDRFRELGLKPEQLAYRGRTFNQGDFQDRNLTSPLLIIEYAWRRRNDDPPDEVLMSNDVFESLSLLHLQDQSKHPSDEEFLRRYFSAIWQNGLPNSVSGVWLLLSRDGHVLDTGTAAEIDLRSTEEQLQKRYPGLRANEQTITDTKSQSGALIRLHYLWLASDSPVTPKSDSQATH